MFSSWIQRLLSSIRWTCYLGPLLGLPNNNGKHGAPGCSKCSHYQPGNKEGEQERETEEMAVVVSRYCSSRGLDFRASVLSTTPGRSQLPGIASPGDRSPSSVLHEHCTHACNQQAHILTGEIRVGCGGIRLQTHGTQEFLIATSSCINGLFHLSGLLWVLHSL